MHKKLSIKSVSGYSLIALKMQNKNGTWYKSFMNIFIDIGGRWPEEPLIRYCHLFSLYYNSHEMVTKPIMMGSDDTNEMHHLFTDDEHVLTLTHKTAAKPGKRNYRRLKWLSQIQISIVTCRM